MAIKRIPLCLNTDDPEQKELLDFVTKLPSGKKRNASAFLRMLVDREYQKKKEKETLEAPRVEVIKSKGGIKYLANQNINQYTDCGPSCSTD
jgi:hypothetical protein